MGTSTDLAGGCYMISGILPELLPVDRKALNRRIMKTG